MAKKQRLPRLDLEIWHLEVLRFFLHTLNAKLNISPNFQRSPFFTSLTWRGISHSYTLNYIQFFFVYFLNVCQDFYNYSCLFIMPTSIRKSSKWTTSNHLHPLFLYRFFVYQVCKRVLLYSNLILIRYVLTDTDCFLYIHARRLVNFGHMYILLCAKNTPFRLLHTNDSFKESQRLSSNLIRKTAWLSQLATCLFITLFLFCNKSAPIIVIYYLLKNPNYRKTWQVWFFKDISRVLLPFSWTLLSENSEKNLSFFFHH